LLENLENGLGLDLVLAVQSTRNGLFDALADMLHAMGGEIFFLVVLLLIYWSLNRHLGIRLIVALIVAGVLNSLLKDLFQRPRPFGVSDLVVPIQTEESFGIPSAHVMVGLVVWGYAALYAKRRWLYWALALFILVMAWSRMYVGVHFPQDVAAGALFGLIVLLLYMRVVEPIAARWQHLNPYLRIGLLVLAGVMTVISAGHDRNALALAGILISIGPAMELELRYANFSNAGTPTQRMLRFVIGITLTLAIFLGLRVLFGALAEEVTTPGIALRLLRYAVVTIFAFFVWPRLALRFGLAQWAEKAKD
jgi:membrane-associated phospholipid phosphatase